MVPTWPPAQPDLEEIAALQGVEPIEDPSELVGGWPGEVDEASRRRYSLGAGASAGLRNDAGPQVVMAGLS